MLRINRLRVEINTVKGVYGIDKAFEDGLNFIASLENTCGKSSILAAIYYCLGFEQILGGAGGIGSKVLTSAFKTAIEGSNEELFIILNGPALAPSSSCIPSNQALPVASRTIILQLTLQYFP